MNPEVNPGDMWFLGWICGMLTVCLILLLMPRR